MDLTLEIARIVMPLVMVGAIGVFVILRMKHKSKKVILGKKKTLHGQKILDSLISFGMMIGLSVAIVLSIFNLFSFLTAITWGPGIGMLCGYLAYEIFSNKKDSYS